MAEPALFPQMEFGAFITALDVNAPKVVDSKLNSNELLKKLLHKARKLNVHTCKIKIHSYPES